MRGEGGLPPELTEADICEHFGWTFSQLDEEDQDRVYTSFALQNVRDIINRIRSWLEHGGKSPLGYRDMELYGKILDAEKEITNG